MLPPASKCHVIINKLKLYGLKVLIYTLWKKEIFWQNTLFTVIFFRFFKIASKEGRDPAVIKTYSILTVCVISINTDVSWWIEDKVWKVKVHPFTGTEVLYRSYGP